MKRRVLILVGPILLAATNIAYPADVATVSFGTGKQATYPQTVKAGPTIDVDLATIPEEATVFRAVLHAGRNEREANPQRNRPIKITVAGSDQECLLSSPNLQPHELGEPNGAPFLPARAAE